MRRDHGEAGAIAAEARAAFEDFVRKRASREPTLLRHTLEAQAWLVPWLAPLRLLPLNSFRGRGKRYVFLSTRFLQLARSFAPAEAAIVGSPSDARRARGSGLPVCLSLDLFVTAYRVMAGREGWADRLVIRRWLDYFRQQHPGCVLVVPNDTLPISTLLVTIARHCPDVLVACIQHGLYEPSFQLDDIDGRLCHVNFVYDDAQRAEMERRLPAAIAEVMGLPVQYSCLERVERTAILVGTGMTEDPQSYQRSLELFTEAVDALGAVGIRSAYRAHPTEGAAGLAAARFPLDRRAKEELLDGARKVFVGFASTLLYEAERAGHAVFVIDGPGLPAYRLSRFGTHLRVDDLGQIGRLAASALDTGPARAATATGLRDRFEAAVARAGRRVNRDQASDASRRGRP